MSWFEQRRSIIRFVCPWLKPLSVLGSNRWLVVYSITARVQSCVLHENTFPFIKRLTVTYTTGGTRVVDDPWGSPASSPPPGWGSVAPQPSRKSMCRSCGILPPKQICLPGLCIALYRQESRCIASSCVAVRVVFPGTSIGFPASRAT